MGFIANFGQWCSAVMEHCVNELSECRQTPVASEDLLDYRDSRLKLSFPLLHEFQ